MHVVQEAGAEDSTHAMYILYQQDDIESVILQLHQRENNVARSFYHILSNISIFFRLLFDTKRLHKSQ